MRHHFKVLICVSWGCLFWWNSKNIEPEQYLRDGMMAQRLDQLSLAQELIWQKPFLVQMVRSLKYRLCILYVFQTFKRHMAEIQARETFYLSVLAHILRGRFTPFSPNSQNYFKFLSFREDTTNSHRDSRVTAESDYLLFRAKVNWLEPESG